MASKALTRRPRAPARRPGGEGTGENLYAVGEAIALRAASPATRKQYQSIYRRFCDFLLGELHRPPTITDLNADTIAAYGRFLERRGGRGGRPAALSTRRLHLTMLRALAGAVGRDDVAGDVRVPSHHVGPPETLTAVEYGNLLRAPDRRSAHGKRDVAVLRVLGDCGLRNAELRGLGAGALRRPRANSRHHSLYVHGKGGIEREVPVPAETYKSLAAWLAVHPQRRGRAGLRDADSLFVRLGPRGSSIDPAPLTNQALYKLVGKHAQLAGIPERLSHPHVLRAYYATTLAGQGVPIHVIKSRLGHRDIQTTARYLAELADDVVGVGEVLDRHHQELARQRLAA